jgi:hypothetical protein
MPPSGIVATVPKNRRPRKGSPLARHTIEELSAERFQGLCSVLSTKRNWDHVVTAPNTAADDANQLDGASKVNLPDEAAADALVADLLEALLDRKDHGGQGSGFVVDPKKRKAIEEHAVTKAKQYLRNKGFRKIKEVGKPYDLLCHKETGEELHVEVKGTTTPGSNIILTFNEVEDAENPATASALYVLSDIVITENPDGSWEAKGGRRHVFCPWQIERSRLKPLAYQYEVKPKK